MIMPQNIQKDLVCLQYTPILVFLFFLRKVQSATTCIKFWLAQPLSSNCLYSVLLPIAYVYALSVFQNVIFPACFRSSNWSIRHGFPSLNILHNIILSHAFNMA